MPACPVYAGYYIPDSRGHGVHALPSPGSSRKQGLTQTWGYKQLIWWCKPRAVRGRCCARRHAVTQLAATSEGALRRPGRSLSSWFLWLQDFSAGVEGGPAPWRDRTRTWVCPAHSVSFPVGKGPPQGALTPLRDASWSPGAAHNAKPYPAPCGVFSKFETRGVPQSMWGHWPKARRRCGSGNPRRHPILQLLLLGKDRQDCPKMTFLGCQATEQLGLKPILTQVGGADPVGLLLGPGDSSSRGCSFSLSSGIQKLSSRPSLCSPKHPVSILNPKMPPVFT